jgi:RNA polymerase sigma-70 factor, ECF subfamily
MAPVRRIADPEVEARAALARGDARRALTLLMQAYGDDIYRHCWLVLGEPDLADEVHQTVFVQAFRDLGRFSGRSTLRTWLLGIARHRCLDALKITRRWRRRFRLGHTTPDPADTTAAADHRLAAAGEAVALSRALAQLPPKVRSAVLLRYHEGLSFEEMSAICGERATTLQARVARAMPVLRRWMEDHE